MTGQIFSPKLYLFSMIFFIKYFGLRNIKYIICIIKLKIYNKMSSWNKNAIKKGMNYLYIKNFSKTKTHWCLTIIIKNNLIKRSNFKKIPKIHSNLRVHIMTTIYKILNILLSKSSQHLLGEYFLMLNINFNINCFNMFICYVLILLLFEFSKSFRLWFLYSNTQDNFSFQLSLFVDT